MPDLDSTHAIVGAVTGTSGLGLAGGLMAFLRGREAREARDALITLQGQMARLIADVEKMSNVSADVTRAKDKADAAHDRIDDLEDRVLALEGRPPASRSRRQKK